MLLNRHPNFGQSFGLRFGPLGKNQVLDGAEILNLSSKSRFLHISEVSACNSPYFSRYKLVMLHRRKNVWAGSAKTTAGRKNLNSPCWGSGHPPRSCELSAINSLPFRRRCNLHKQTHKPSGLGKKNHFTFTIRINSNKFVKFQCKVGFSF